MTLILFDFAHQISKKMMHVPGDGVFLPDKRHGHGGYMTTEDSKWVREMCERKGMKHWQE